ncbi:HAD-superfamily hydrolase [Legionella steigerwaltii]|uniref:HAD-superfamily hydrolase n=1 Tax=Legionella steigerwaltii TaxID=460 RepID=A0A378L951_9GAMM|nr:HAD-IA family hydrolase [Legionella steigerwaltii]KTD77013.1 HAD-superfamily hydrolase [Legionella steigerwaltii]STY22442.1 HAD-superfamily hydrolase [Legionella steigerwaltii]
MHLLFDFDGTLVDSYDCVIEKTNLLAEQFNFRKIKEHEIEHLRDLSSRELINFLGISFYKIPSLIRQIRHLLHEQMVHMKPVSNIPSILETFYKSGYSLGILTSNSVENVHIWLDTHQIHHFFNFIHDESNCFSKRHLLKKTLKKYKIDKNKVFYIGDETRDIEAAKRNNIQSIAVTWGYNSEKTLLKHHPTYLAKQPEDLLTICSPSFPVPNDY